MPELYAVGDAHGMSGLLREALTFIDHDASQEPARAKWTALRQSGYVGARQHR